MAESLASKYETKIFVVIIIAAAIFFGWLLFKPEEKKETVTVIKMVDLSEFSSLPLTEIGNLTFVTLKINGNAGQFLVDTGAEESIFNIIYLDSLGITMADSLPLPGTQIYITDTVAVSSDVDSTFTFDKRFYTYNLSGLQNKISESDSTFTDIFFMGILGQDVMLREGMILNFQNNKIYLTNKYNKTF